jgi:hypothetical protein
MNDVDVATVVRLAKGSHHRHTGKMCAMNLVSRERGDRLVTDYPANVAPALARFCHHLNDRVCAHSEIEVDLLCQTCSAAVIDVAHATVGTENTPAELAWRWAGAVADLAALELDQDYPWVAARLRGSAGSCREIARQIAVSVPTSISVATESRAAGQSASSALGDVLGRSDAARTIRFAARAVAVWHEMAGSVPVTTPVQVTADVWAAARVDADLYASQYQIPMGVWPVVPPTWLPAVGSLSLVLTS